MKTTVGRATIFQGDCRQILASLPANSVHMVCTSPPYWGLRDYKIEPSIWGGDSACEHEWGETVVRRGSAQTQGATSARIGRANVEVQSGQAHAQGQFCQKCGAWCGCLGLEPTPKLFVEHIVEVFEAVRRVLRPDGVCFMNMGDSYASTSTYNAPRTSDGEFGRIDSPRQPNAGIPCGLKPKDLVGVPWRCAFALQEAGWWLRSDIIWCLSGGTRVYARTQKGEAPMTIKDMVRLDPATVQLWNGEKWTQVRGWNETPRPDRTYELELRNGQRIGCTANHEWPVEPAGNIRTDALKVGDVIRRCTLPEPAEPRAPGLLDDDIGWFIGLYIAEGSRHEGTINIASHTKEADRFDRLARLAESLHGTAGVHKTSENGCTVALNGPMLWGLIDTYVSGELAAGKHLHPRCWQRSNAFLRAVLDGYLSGDGHWDQDNQRWRLGFTANDELVADLRTVGARLGVSVRLRRYVHKMDGREFPGYRGELRFERSAHHNSRDDGEIVAIRESRARKFWDIGVADEPHLFALASGVLTHNSKPNPMPESVTDRPTKSHEYVFLLTKSERYFWDAEAVREGRTSDEDAKEFRGGCYVGGETDNNTLGKRAVVGNRRIKVPGGWDRGDGAHGTIHRDGRTSAEYQEAEVRSGRNIRSVWTIATAPFAEAHFACVDAETECLTATGWKRHADIRPGMLAAQFDVATQKLSWAPVEKVARYDVTDQEMVVGSCRDLEMWLTPNHRTVIQRRHPRTRAMQPPTIIRADELLASHSVPTAADWSYSGDATVPLEWAELLGWYVAEGHESKDSLSIELYQSEARNGAKCRRIEELLRQVGAEWTSATCKRQWRGRAADMTAYRISGYAAVRLRELAPGKKAPFAAVLWSNDRIEALLAGLIGGDGHTRPEDGRRCFVQKDAEQCGLVQALAMRLGLSATTSTRKDGVGTVWLTKHRTRSFRGTNGAGSPPGRRAYTGTVWCPKLPAGTWVARRNGKPFITGNTFPPALVERCVKAGTSERGCCPACGAPWVRIVERVDQGYDGSRYGERAVAATGGAKTGGTAASTLGSSNGKLVGQRETAGWRPTCQCKARRVCDVCEGGGLGAAVPAPRAPGGLAESCCEACDGKGFVTDPPEPIPCTVLDPFAGAGTTLLVADRLQRSAIGIELNPDYVTMSVNRIRGDAPLFAAAPG